MYCVNVSFDSILKKIEWNGKLKGEQQTSGQQREFLNPQHFPEQK